MEGSVASVQIPPETPRPGIPTPRPPATSTLGLLGFFVQLLQVFVSLFILHRLWFVSFSKSLLLVQFLLQPLLPEKLLQRQPLQVQIVLHVSFTESSSAEER